MMDFAKVRTKMKLRTKERTSGFESSTKGYRKILSDVRYQTIGSIVNSKPKPVLKLWTLTTSNKLFIWITLNLFTSTQAYRSLHFHAWRFLPQIEIVLVWICDGHLSLVCAAESFNLVFPTFGDTLDIRAARDLIQTFSDSVHQFFPINFNKT
jgi:hypothetical protein